MLYVHTELVYTKIMLYRLSKRSQCCAVKIEQMYSTHRLYCTVHMERCTEVILYCPYGAVYRGYAVHMEQVYRGYAVHMEQVYKGYAVHGKQVYTQVLQHILL